MSQEMEKRMAESRSQASMLNVKLLEAQEALQALASDKAKIERHAKVTPTTTHHRLLNRIHVFGDLECLRGLGKTWPPVPASLRTDNSLESPAHALQVDLAPRVPPSAGE